MNITNFNHLVKIGWIKRLLQSSGTWQNIFEQTICPCKKLTWELDIDSLTVLEKITANQFWADVLSSWKYYKEMYSKEIDVRTYAIIGPSFVVHKNLISITKELTNKSILHINDIMSPNGKIFGYQEFKQFYNININFLDFYSLTHCIPKQWTKVLNFQKKM